MKKKYEFCLSVILVLMAFLLAMAGVRRQEGNLAARIAPEILRFHVLANSDSAEDQALKLEVKDLLLEEIQSGLATDDAISGGLAVTAGSPTGTPALTRADVETYIRENHAQLESAAETYMLTRGFDYSADIRLETCEFPEKTYGDMTFPAGTYDAVRVILGDGAGQNFWCVLYPSLCYMDSTHAVVPDSSKELLQTLISEDDFQSLLCARKGTGYAAREATRDASTQKTEQDSLLPRIQIRFKLLELLDL